MYNKCVKKKVCIFGGTFDPPHLAHAEIIEQAKSQLNADLVIVVPCGQPVHKDCSVQAKDRLEMSRLAFSHLPKTVVSDYEIKKREKSYTLHTLRYFKSKYKRAEELFFIIGSDSLEEFPTWYKPEEIAKLAKIVVVPRANHDFRKAKQFFEKNYKSKPIVLKNEPTNVSATELRIMTEFGLDTSQFLKQEVIDYIEENKLYTGYSDICRKAKEYLKSDRLTHTVYTVHEGLKLAKRTDADADKVFLACALHDIGKSIHRKDWLSFGFTNAQNLPEGIIHAELGAVMAERVFGITDEVVLNAIRYHTTARPGMAIEEKIVYAADMVEISRSGMDELRAKVESDFDNGFLSCLKISYNFAVSEHGAENVHSLTKKSITYYRKELREKNEKAREKARTDNADLQSADGKAGV